MARSPASILAEQFAPERYAALRADRGCATNDQLPDGEHDLIAATIRGEHLTPEVLSGLYQQALIEQGLAVDTSAAPARFLAKATEAGLSHGDITEFVQENYDMDRKEALRQFQEDLARAKKVDEDADFKRNYGSPF